MCIRDRVWMMDTYMNIVGTGDRNSVRGVVTGKSVTSGGSYGRAEATGQGVVHCITEWAKDRNFNLDGCHVIIQGFGDAGSYAANTEGINPHKLGEHVNKTGSVAGYKGAQKIDRAEFFALDDHLD